MMLSINYKQTTGEIVSYCQGSGEIPDGCGQIQVPLNTKISSDEGQINKKVRLRDKVLVPLRPSLLGERRAKILAWIASQSPQGCFVELGVYRGGTAWYLLEMANRQKRTLHLFDTFTGIPHKSHMDLNNIGDFGDVDLEEVRELLPEAVFHVGLFPDTMADDVQDIAFIHADMDVYQSMKAIKPNLWNRMVKGGMIFFDDCDLEGVLNAIHEDFDGLVQEYRSLNMLYVVKE